MEGPKNLRYSKDHEWISATAGSARVGVTAFAIEQLGDVVHVELPTAGDSFEAGASFGTIESTKTVSDLYMPLACTIVDVNREVESKPEMIQLSPYEKGWLVKVTVKQGVDTSALLDADAYKSHLTENVD